MQPYKNPAGNSGIVAYEVGDDGITVMFIGGDVYLYTLKSAGAANIRQMIKLAKAGKGLSTYISTSVKNGYEQKL